MAPTATISRQRKNGLETVRAEILTSLHLGSLAPGDQAPSVRELAQRAGLNLKTVHRAYTRLAAEGLLEMQPGRGTFVADRGVKSPGAKPIADLIRMAKRSQAAALECGLSPTDFYAFAQVFNGDGLRGLPLAIVECNREQSIQIANQLEKSIGIAPRLVSLGDLKRRGPIEVHGAWGVVTTDCHLDEVRERVHGFGTPVYSVALDGTFPRRIAESARENPLIWIVKDLGFEPVFVRLLKQLKIPRRVIDRISFIEPEDLDLGALEKSRATVIASPLLRRRSAWLQAHGIAVRTAEWFVDRRSLERLRAQLALDFSQES